MPEGPLSSWSPHPLQSQPSTRPGTPGYPRPRHDARAHHRRRSPRHRPDPPRRWRRDLERAAPQLRARRHRDRGRDRLHDAGLGGRSGADGSRLRSLRDPAHGSRACPGRARRHPGLRQCQGRRRPRRRPLPDRHRLRRGDHRDHAPRHPLGAARALRHRRGDRHRECQPARRAARHRAARRRPRRPRLDGDIRCNRPAHGVGRDAGPAHGAGCAGKRAHARADRREPAREPAWSSCDPGRSSPTAAPDHGRVHNRAVRLRGRAVGRPVSAGRARPRPRAGKLRAPGSRRRLQYRHARLRTARSPFRRSQGAS